MWAEYADEEDNTESQLQKQSAVTEKNTQASNKVGGVASSSSSDSGKRKNVGNENEKRPSSKKNVTAASSKSTNTKGNTKKKMTKQQQQQQRQKKQKHSSRRKGESDSESTSSSDSSDDSSDSESYSGSDSDSDSDESNSDDSDDSDTSDEETGKSNNNNNNNNTKKKEVVDLDVSGGPLSKAKRQETLDVLKKKASKRHKSKGSKKIDGHEIRLIETVVSIVPKVGVWLTSLVSGARSSKVQNVPTSENPVASSALSGNTLPDLEGGRN